MKEARYDWISFAGATNLQIVCNSMTDPRNPGRNGHLVMMVIVMVMMVIVMVMMAIVMVMKVILMVMMVIVMAMMAIVMVVFAWSSRGSGRRRTGKGLSRRRRPPLGSCCGAMCLQPEERQKQAEVWKRNWKNYLSFFVAFVL